jgi:hypothetical protein
MELVVAAAAVLADKIPVEIRLGRVFCGETTAVVSLLDNIVLDRIPELLCGCHVMHPS